MLSDSHGDYEQIASIVGRHREDADAFLHLGDGEEEFLELSSLYPELDMRSVRGNCDWRSSAPATGMMQAHGTKIMYTHGHNYQVKIGRAILWDAAYSLGAKVALFGHTHTAMSSFDSGIHLINPGSVAIGYRRSYAIIDIGEDYITPQIIPL